MGNQSSRQRSPHPESTPGSRPIGALDVPPGSAQAASMQNAQANTSTIHEPIELDTTADPSATTSDPTELNTTVDSPAEPSDVIRWTPINQPTVPSAQTTVHQRDQGRNVESGQQVASSSGKRKRKASDSGDDADEPKRAKGKQPRVDETDDESEADGGSDDGAADISDYEAIFLTTRDDAQSAIDGPPADLTRERMLKVATIFTVFEIATMLNNRHGQNTLTRSQVSNRISKAMNSVAKKHGKARAEVKQDLELHRAINGVKERVHKASNSVRGQALLGVGVGVGVGVGASDQTVTHAGPSNFNAGDANIQTQEPAAEEAASEAADSDEDPLGDLEELARRYSEGSNSDKNEDE